MTFDFSRLKTCSLRGKIFRLIWKKPPEKHPDPTQEYLGQCDSPRDKGRELWLDPKQEAEDLFWTMFHETTHGCFFDLEEAAIEEFERDVRRFAKRMGFCITIDHERAR